MSVEIALILLFIVAMTVAIVVRHLRLPYTVGLVLAGLLLGWIRAFPAPHLNQALLFAVFLPGLIFEAAFHLNFREFWRNRITISALAFPGVFAAILLTALTLAPLANALGFLPGFTWRHALVFGALISATDPVAVLSLFRSLGIPRRLSLLLEGESLLNDGTGIVFFTLSLSLLTGTAVTARAISIEFMTVVGMGLAIGAAVGLAVSMVVRQVDDPMIEISLTTIAAYGSFAAADHLHYSGVIATVASGMLCGNYGARTGMSASTRVAVEAFWEYVAFALNSVVFLLIGIEVPIGRLLSAWPSIIVAYLIVTLARAFVIHAVWRLVSLTRERFPAIWSLVLTWGGLRGALPMVLALALPPDFPFRDQIISTTFGVVTLSILGHGLTMPPLLRWLGIVRGGKERSAYDLLRGELQIASAGLDEIESLRHLHAIAPASLDRLRQEYEKRLQDVRDKLSEVATEGSRQPERDLPQARHRLLVAEKDRALEAYRRGLIAPAIHDRLLADIDARILELETKGEPADEAQVKS
ncbi:MAG TPA: Na+/H+ antiporter [Stellaceae bacterium]|nr:Na+/H+ antiporter [Stellaceae bacterium]